MIHLGPFMVNWHGILTAVGILAGWYVSRKMAGRLGVEPEEISRLVPYVVLAAIVGGRVAYVLSHLSEFANNYWEIIRIDRGGLASHGALLFGITTVYFYARRRGLSAKRLLDALALAVPINYLAMRIGNFLIGELYGDPTTLPWGVIFPHTAAPRHPAQLYDGAGQLLVLLVMVRLWRRGPREGELARLALTGTSVVRLMSDVFRSEWRVFGPLTLGQIGAVLTTAVATVWLWPRHETKQAVTGQSLAAPPR